MKAEEKEIYVPIWFQVVQEHKDKVSKNKRKAWECIELGRKEED